MRITGIALAIAVLLTTLAGAHAFAQDENAPAPAAETTVAADTGVATATTGEEELTWGEAFIKQLIAGGEVMPFLLILSVFGVGYAIERFANLRRGRIVPPGLTEKISTLWQQERWKDLRELATAEDSTLARVYATIARHRHSSLGDLSVMAGDVASRDLKRHLQRAYPLAVVATIAPLLGLLGTVLGMIGAFGTVAKAGALGDASLLGADISKALITTASGLTIAVPALGLYHYFRSRINLYGIMLEEEVSESLSDWYGAPTDDVIKEAADED